MDKENPSASIRKTDSKITFTCLLDHFLARWGVNRSGHTVEPGLYSIGSPDADSPVFVTANYTLSFDALRKALDGIDGYVLVLDTKGVNVWCAAGKGTFGSDELINRIRLVKLDEVVNHKRLILPQLGGPGIAAAKVKKETGFKVEFGPVRAGDIPQYLKEGKATPEMRKVTFRLWERAVLIPVELTGAFVPAMVAALILYFISGFTAMYAMAAAALAGTVLFPLLLPFIPGKDFSLKGYELGLITTLPFAFITFTSASPALPLWHKILTALPHLLLMPSVTSFLALNFTGSTPFTSKTAVKREMKRYIPIMAWAAGIGIVLFVVMYFVR